MRTRLKRTMTALDKLKKQRARLIKTVKTVGAVPVSVPAHPTVDSETTLGTLPPVKPTPDLRKMENDLKRAATEAVGQKIVDAGLDIPGFLRRQGPSDADKAAADTIKAEQAATKKAKAQGRIATMKAKKSGETRKMPLTGKAALALINNG